MEKKVTILHIEDNEGWLSSVKEDIEANIDPLLLKKIHIEQRRSIAESRSLLKYETGAIILLVDLRDEDEEFTGLSWLLDELHPYIRKHISTAVFVITGEGRDAKRRQALFKIGISENQIFDKGDWVEKRSVFIQKLTDAIKFMDKEAIRNISKGIAGRNLDHQLRHELEKIGENLQNPQGEVNSEVLKNKFSILIKALEDDWDYSKIPDLQVLGRVGTIFSARGTYKSVMELAQDLSLSVEASLPTPSVDVHESVAFSKQEDDLLTRKNTLGTKLIDDINEKGDSVIIGIIDNGIDITHKSFQDKKGKTRIIALWDQRGGSASPPANTLLGIDADATSSTVGSEYTEDDINGFLESGNIPSILRFQRFDHGTHVASIAAGSESEDFRGVAPKSKIIAVITDSQNSSLGYSSNHMLAITYISEIAKKYKLPTVVNISQGMNAGAHDGTSTLEKVCDTILNNGQRRGFVIVKSAGNERAKGIHAKFRVDNGYREFLKWKAVDGEPGSDYIELWYESDRRFRFRLQCPSPSQSEIDVSDWVDTENPIVKGTFSTGENYSIEVTPYHEDNGDTRLSILIDPKSSWCSITSGEWVLEIDSYYCKRYGDVHAWLERSRRTTRFVNHVSYKSTLTIPGTARYIISVGAVEEQDDGIYKLAEYSAYGPTRDGREKPEIVALGEDVIGADSSTITGSMSNSGTSMAAPQVTGVIALLFSHWYKENKPQLNAAQIQKLISQFSKTHTGDWHRGGGYGVLNAENFLEEIRRMLI
ncbi:MAG: S8 family serine peptidase [Bacteroidota bacterium]